MVSLTVMEVLSGIISLISQILVLCICLLQKELHVL